MSDSLSPAPKCYRCSCTKEPLPLRPGQRFCENCGTLIDAQNIIPAPGTAPAEEPLLLIDYYVGTTPAREAVGMSGTSEWVLGRWPDGTLQLDFYVGDSVRRTEIKTSYRVPAEAYDRVMAVIRAQDMPHWADQPAAPSPVGGPVLVCKFRIDDQLIRVSTDRMPERGGAAFYAVEGAMRGWTKEEYRLKE